MGTYNILQTSITCPHCNTLVDVEIEMRFGDTYMLDKFVIRDQYKWVSGKTFQYGGRPEEGNLDGEGYAECPNCRRDLFVKVLIRKDRIESAGPDTEKAAYIQKSDVASIPPSPKTTNQPSASPAWEPKPGVRKTGKIFHNEKWELTPKINGLLEQLLKFGVDISSTWKGDDYTILVPPDLSHEQYDEVDSLMKKLGKEVKGNVDYVDWYPHGWKFRIYPHKENKS